MTGHKNHPEIWAGGDFSMIDPSELIKRIAGRAELILGDVDQTIEAFTKPSPKTRRSAGSPLM